MSLTLFDLVDYDFTARKIVHDPYWDEIVLDDNGQIEADGQLNLFYDDSQEPPDPDDFQSIDDFETAWTGWAREHPDFESDMSPVPDDWEEDFMDVLEDLPTLPEQNLATCKTSTQQEDEPINSEICQPVEVLPEQNNSVLEDLNPTLPEHKYSHWTERYYVTRRGSKHWYYRYCYYFGRIHHIHIPGGNSGNAIACQRLEMVNRAIAAGQTPFQIQNLIRGGFKVTTDN